MANPPRKPRKPSAIPKDETKDARFKRVANVRVPKCLQSIGNLGQLGGSRYTSNADQRKKIVDALTEAVKKVQGQLEGAKDDKPAFSV